MRRRFPLTLTLLGLAAVAHAAGPEVVPVPPPKAGEWSEVKAAPGRLLVLSAQPASKWLLVDDEGCELRDFDAGKSAAFCAPSPGRYKLIVTGPDGSASKVVVVVVGDAPPPGPKPNPPDPPKPPADPLKDKIARAFADDPEADGPKKKGQAKDLAELYRQLAAKVVPDPALTGPAELLQRAKDTAKLLIGDTALLGVRRAAGEELAVVLPDPALSDAQRVAAAKLFQRLAVILDTLGG